MLLPQEQGDELVLRGLGPERVPLGPGAGPHPASSRKQAALAAPGSLQQWKAAPGYQTQQCHYISWKREERGSTAQLRKILSFSWPEKGLALSLRVWGSGSCSRKCSAAVPSAALSPAAKEAALAQLLPETSTHTAPSPGSSPALLPCWKEDSGDDSLCFISPSHCWTGKTSHSGDISALKGRVGQAVCGLYRAAVADTGVEWAQNKTDKLLLALSSQFCSSQGTCCQLSAAIQDKMMHKALLYSQSVIQHDPKWQLHIAETAFSSSWKQNQDFYELSTKNTKKFTSNWIVTSKPAVKPLLVLLMWKEKRY